MSETDQIVMETKNLVMVPNAIKAFEFTPAPPAPNIRLHSPDGRQATIDFGGDVVMYSGDLPVSEGAKIFFDAVGHHLVSALRHV